jgi:hypothetical protein
MLHTKLSEFRAHHFAPQCWLAGFTDSGGKTGTLWVTDLSRRKQWNTSPPNAGHRRDFYRLSDPGLDPVGFEKEFSKIESTIAPLLRTLYERPRWPLRDELEDLLFFAALQYVRVPAFRPTMLRVADSHYREQIAKDLETKASWEAALEKASIPLDSPGAEYEQMLEFEREKRYTLSAENEWFLIRGFEAAENAIIPALKERYWTPLLSTNGSFIASDNPVTMDGPKGEMVGFKSAEVVIFPVNRYLLLFGTKVPIRPPHVTFKLIARHNTFTMLHATDHVYSHIPDFCWMDALGKCQSDWELFSKDKLIDLPPPE